MSRIIMHRGDIGLELVKQERTTHQLTSSDLIGCGSSSSAIADGKFTFKCWTQTSETENHCIANVGQSLLFSFTQHKTDHLDDDLDHDDDDGVDVINHHHHQNVSTHPIQHPFSNEYFKIDFQFRLFVYPPH